MLRCALCTLTVPAHRQTQIRRFLVHKRADVPLVRLLSRADGDVQTQTQLLFLL